jgi:hypothetical protein
MAFFFIFCDCLPLKVGMALSFEQTCMSFTQPRTVTVVPSLNEISPVVQEKILKNFHSIFAIG